jgi:hypothetical protein
MTRCEELEMKRFTKQMWSLLRFAETQPAEVWGPSTRTARILKRRGFLDMARNDDGEWGIHLTDAGREALARKEF